jgi:hypothetical protein
LNWSTGATPTAQVDTLTVGGTWEVDDIAIITLTAPDGTQQSLSVTSGSTNTTTIASTIATAFNASTQDALFEDHGPASTNTITLTADNAGVPFICTVSTTEAGGGGADADVYPRVDDRQRRDPDDRRQRRHRFARRQQFDPLWIEPGEL